MHKEEGIKSFTKVFRRINEAFPNTNEKHFKFNLWFDGLVALIVLINTIGSSIDHFIYALNSTVKSCVLKKNISEFYIEPSFIISILIPIAMFVLCYVFCMLLDKKRTSNSSKPVKK